MLINVLFITLRFFCSLLVLFFIIYLTSANVHCGTIFIEKYNYCLLINLFKYFFTFHVLLENRIKIHTIFEELYTLLLLS